MRKDNKKKDKYSGLQGRTKKRNEDKNSFPGGEGILNLPEGYEFFSPKKGRNEIEILPFNVGENHPDVVKGEIEEGDVDYVLDIWVHRGIGVNNSSVVCPNSNFGEPCPICEEVKMMKDQGLEKEDYKDLYPKRRVIYNIFDHADEKVKIFSVSHFLFAKELQEEVEANNDEGEIIFAHPKIGKTIKFRAVEEEIGKNTFFKYKSFEFVDREEEIDEEILEQAITIDEYLNIKSYEQIKSLFHSGVPDDNDDEEDEEETQKRKDKKYFNKIKEDQESEEKKSKKSKKNKCSFGYEFGVDTDEKDECNECEEWDECDAEKHGS